MKAIANLDMWQSTFTFPRIDGEYRKYEPMSLHTSFRIGGEADYFAVASSVSDLRALLKWAQDEQMPVFILGAGTNILVSDAGIRGLVIKMGGSLAEISISGNRLIAGSAVRLHRLVADALDYGLVGVESLSGIPGTVGGAVCMNAGASGSSVQDTLEYVTVINDNADLYQITSDQLNFRYRGSLVKDEGLTVVQAVFKLRQGSVETARDTIRQLHEKRKCAQPSGKTAGSVFKNPTGDYAGRILESIGAKGLQVGDARVSMKHANFIENRGEASAEDIRCLVDKLIYMAFEQKGIRLEPEIQLVGEWN
ncbi:MAG: UDP-N-acetylmuramate dehydrogenase [Armatimonadota bacterium]